MEDWQELNSQIARDMFRKDDQLRRVADTLSGFSEFSLSYIQQAPVLVLAAAANDHWSLYKGWPDKLREGPKLRDLLAWTGVAYPLRGLLGAALSSDDWPVIVELSQIDPSTLAQTLPKRIGLQRIWLNNLADWVAPDWITHSPLQFPWIAARAAYLSENERYSIRTITDYIERSRRPFDTKWTFQQALEHANQWHTELRSQTRGEQFRSEHGIGWEDPIDYGEFALRMEIDGFEIVALNSGKALFEEGAAMHHCVASYDDDVARGKSRIYSIRKNGVRLATMELKKHLRLGSYNLIQREDKWHVTQCKGPCNAQPTEEVRAVMKKIGV